MYYDEHNPPHLHAEYKKKKAVFDFNGNIIKGNLNSRTAIKLIREWIDFHIDDLQEDWELARIGKQVKEIEPLG